MSAWEKPVTNCPCCDTKVDRLHQKGCKLERCPFCGDQTLFCRCEPPPDADRLPWVGTFPGEVECRENDWWGRLVPGTGWVRCGADEPGAGPDFARFSAEYRWNREQRKDIRRKKA